MSGQIRQSGISLVEILVTTVMAALLLAGVQQLLSLGMESKALIGAQIELNREARFAMSRVVMAVRATDRLLLPLADNPGTTWREHVREQSVPASAPETGSTMATAVLAMTLPATQDLDSDGWADANNDRDYQDLNANLVRDVGEPERIDEDHGNDMSNDGAPGIISIDDDGDGAVDESDADIPDRDDDEEAGREEDFTNGIDDDADGSKDEDGAADMNKDFEAGLVGVDDDGDGSVDEGHFHDDDEDGAGNEDWLDPLVFYLQGSTLTERRAVPWDENADSVTDGRDFVESILADNVTLLRFERIALTGARQLVDITLTLTDENGESLTLHTRVRVGGSQ